MRSGEAEAGLEGCRASACLDLEGSGRAEVCSGSGFLDHMLRALARTGRLDLRARAEGGAGRNEALGRAIGLALDLALGDRSGIRRYGSSSVPMDDSLAEIALDLGGRPYLVLRGRFRGEGTGDLEVAEIARLLEAFCVGGRLTLHISIHGSNDHHKAEAIFKALGLAVREAASVEGGGVPSTKGVI